MEAARGRAELGPAPAARKGRRGAALGARRAQGARRLHKTPLNNKFCPAFGAMRQRRTKGSRPSFREAFASLKLGLERTARPMGRAA